MSQSLAARSASGTGTGTASVGYEVRAGAGDAMPCPRAYPVPPSCPASVAVRGQRQRGVQHVAMPQGRRGKGGVPNCRAKATSQLSGPLPSSPRRRGSLLNVGVCGGIKCLTRMQGTDWHITTNTLTTEVLQTPRLIKQKYHCFFIPLLRTCPRPPRGRHPLVLYCNRNPGREDR